MRRRTASTVGIPGGLALLAYDTASTIAQAKEFHARAGRPNLFIKIPGTREGLPAIEEANLPASRSTSHCSSRASTTSSPLTPTCAA